MNITQSELRILEELQEPKSVHDIAASLDLSDGYASRIAHSLKEKGLVRIHRDGKRKIVSPADNTAVQVFYELIQEYGHINWPNLLSGKAVESIYYLDEPHTVAEIADKTENYRNTINRELKPLLNRGIVAKTNGKYQINDNFRKVIQFIHALIRHGHRQTVKQFTGQFRIIWTDLDSFLIETPNPIESNNFHETGTRILQNYDIPIISTKKRYYLYDKEKKEIKPEEALCHLLLIDQSPRFLTYSLLLIKKENLREDEVMPIAEFYEVGGIINQLFTYLEREGQEEIKKFPSWKEFRSTASEYEVTV